MLTRGQTVSLVYTLHSREYVSILCIRLASGPRNFTNYRIDRFDNGMPGSHLSGCDRILAFNLRAKDKFLSSQCLESDVARTAKVHSTDERLSIQPLSDHRRHPNPKDEQTTIPISLRKECEVSRARNQWSRDRWGKEREKGRDERVRSWWGLRGVSAFWVGPISERLEAYIEDEESCGLEDEFECRECPKDRLRFSLR